ncbi:MAG: glycosyltransferase [Candidatus Hydrogenedentota bacterium]|nr:MAG: glycosyltransferase [Candidatus Hydrogenedentota bacterium]
MAKRMYGLRAAGERIFYAGCGDRGTYRTSRRSRRGGTAAMTMRSAASGDERVRLCLLIGSADFGGAERHIEHIVRYVDAEHVVVALAEGPMVEAWREAGARVYVVPESFRLPFRSVHSVRRIIKEEKPDVIHSHTPKANLLGAWLGAVPPRMMTIHGSHRQFEANRAIPAAWYRWADLWASRGARLVIAVCERDREELIENGFPADRLETVNNGVPDPGFEEIPLEERRSVLWVGRFTEEKDPELMREVARLCAEHPRIEEVVMVGSGPLVEELDLGSIPKLRWLESHSKPEELMRRAVVVVNTSRSEGASLTLMSALACGTPIVASAVGGNPETVGEAGRLLPLRDPAERAGDAAVFAEAIKMFLEDETAWREASCRARGRYESRFRVEMMARRLSDLYFEQARRGRVFR